MRFVLTDDEYSPPYHSADDWQNSPHSTVWLIAMIEQV